jgi:AcrR family transcriptional regulator
MKSSDLHRGRDLLRRSYYKEAILHAAERVILRKGYSATTMDDVAREAQLSKATIYKYVPGKSVLLFEIVSHYFDDLRDRIAGIADGPGSAGEKLGQFVQVILQSGEDVKNVSRVLFMDKAMFKLMRVFVPPHGKAGLEAPADRKMLAVLGQKRQEMIDRGARILEEGVASGEFRGMDTDQATAYIVAVLQGYAHMRFWQGDPPLLPTAADRLTQFIIEGIRNPEHAVKEN